jgi:alpha-beta hydrolase superfamily lysophospholipase
MITRADLKFDVTAAVRSSEKEKQFQTAWLFVPPPKAINSNSRLIVCLPGGSYDKRYYHLEVAGHPDYSMAEYLARAGHVVLSVDHWAIGGSSRPSSAGEVTPEAIAAGNHLVTITALQQLRDGTLHSGLGPVELTSVGVGHSMGGLLTIVQQSMCATHQQVIILGKSPAKVSGKFVEGIKSFLSGSAPDKFLLPDRKLARQAFYRPDVPREVISEDEKGVTVVPGAVTERNLTADIATKEAAKIEVPVFLGISEHDTITNPHDEPRYYSASRDITLFILQNSAHCHNFASTRHELWERIVRWLRNFDSSPLRS